MGKTISCTIWPARTARWSEIWQGKSVFMSLRKSSLYKSRWQLSWKLMDSPESACPSVLASTYWPRRHVYSWAWLASVLIGIADESERKWALSMCICKHIQEMQACTAISTGQTLTESYSLQNYQRTAMHNYSKMLNISGPCWIGLQADIVSTRLRIWASILLSFIIPSVMESWETSGWSDRAYLLDQ